MFFAHFDYFDRLDALDRLDRQKPSHKDEATGPSEQVPATSVPPEKEPNP